MITLASLIGALLESFNLASLLPLFNLLLGNPGGTGTPAGQLWVMNLAERLFRLFPNQSPLTITCVLFIGLSFINLAVNTSNQFLIVNSSSQIIYTYRRKVFEIYRKAPISFVLDHKGGELLYNAAIPPAKVGSVMLHISQLLLGAMKVLGLVGVLLIFSPRLTGFLIAAGGLGYFILARITNRLFYNFGKMLRDSLTEMNTIISEFITGFKQIKVANAEHAWELRYDLQNMMTKRTYMQSLFYKALPSPMIQFLVILFLFGSVILFSIFAPAEFGASMAFLGVVGLALIRIAPAFAGLSQHPIEIANNMADIERMYEILHSVPTAPQHGDTSAAVLRPRIKLENVTFAYPEREALFKELNLEFEEGRFTAVVGLSGSGKTTLMNLILGLYRPDSGCVKVDGIDLRDLDPETWYARLGYVSQDIMLFHASILENIRLFSDKFSETEVVRAARIALADDFIETLPEAYHTVVGERGMRLSGGQQQRVAIARAVLHNPDVLLLDEATSALDTVSERLVQQAIYSAAKGRTVIAIAHRLSTIMNADRIIVLENGQVVEQGTHTDLIARGGVYTRLAQTQPNEPICSG